MKKKIFAVLLLQFCWCLLAQQHSRPFLETDKEIYTAGGALWFSVSFWDAEGLNLQNSPDHVLAALVNEKRELLDLHYFETLDALSQNAYYLSSSLKPGRYFFVVFPPTALGMKQYRPVVKPILVRRQLVSKLLVQTQWVEGESEMTLQADIRRRSTDEGVRAGLVLEGSKNRMDWDTLAIGRSGRDGRKQWDNSDFQSTDYPFMRLQVQSSVDSLVHPVAQRLNLDYKVRFLPAGGNLVYGSANTLYLRTTTETQQAVRLRGTLLEDEKPISTFNTDEGGWATLKFKPEKGRFYRVEVESKKKKAGFDLPLTLFNTWGMEMVRYGSQEMEVHLNGPKENAELQLQATSAEGKSSSWDLAWTGKDSLYTLPLDAGTKKLNFRLLKGKQVLAQQEIILRPFSDDLQVVIEPESEQDYYQSREAVKLGIQIRDKKGGVPQGVVYGIKAVSLLNLEKRRSNQLHQFLSQERFLKQEQWAYPQEGFSLVFQNKPMAGTGRFSVLDEVPLQTLVTGEIYQKAEKGLSAAGSTNYLLISANGVSTQFTRSNGSFILPILELMGRPGEQIIVKPACKDCQIQLKNTKKHLERQLKEYLKNQDFDWPLEAQDDLFDQRVQEQISLSGMNFLDEVVVVKRRKEKDGERRNEFGAYMGGVGDYVCHAYNVLNCINHNTGGYPPEDGKYYRTNTGGRILYRKKKPKPELLDPFKLNPFAVVEGFYPSQVFEDPDYSLSKESGTADQRETLVWKLVNTTKSGEAKHTFFTADYPGIYRVEVVAFTQEGKSGRAEIEIRVY